MNARWSDWRAWAGATVVALTLSLCAFALRAEGTGTRDTMQVIFENLRTLLPGERAVVQHRQQWRPVAAPHAVIALGQWHGERFGAAARLWHDGVDGIYTFNLFPGPGGDAERMYARRVRGTIGSPDRLADSTILYALSDAGSWMPTHYWAKDAEDFSQALPLQLRANEFERTWMHVPEDLAGVIAGDEEPTTIQFSAYLRDLTDTGVETLNDIALWLTRDPWAMSGYGDYVSSNWESVYASSAGGDAMINGVSIKFEIINPGDTSGDSHVMVANLCFGSMSISEGDPDTITISLTCTDGGLGDPTPIMISGRFSFHCRQRPSSENTFSYAFSRIEQVFTSNTSACSGSEVRS